MHTSLIAALAVGWGQTFDLTGGPAHQQNLTGTAQRDWWFRVIVTPTDILGANILSDYRPHTPMKASEGTLQGERPAVQYNHSSGK